MIVFIILFILFVFWLNHKKVFIEFEKTICFGFCPEYRLVIYENGEVEYNGKKNVKITGKRKYNLSKLEFKKIKDQIQKADFYNLKNEYDAMITDLPSTIITINNKRVRARYNIPKELKKLIDLIHSHIP